MLCMMKCKLHNFKISYKFSHIINLAHKHFFCKYYCGYTSWDIFSKCLFPMTIQRSELIMKLITILVGAKKFKIQNVCTIPYLCRKASAKMTFFPSPIFLGKYSRTCI